MNRRRLKKAILGEALRLHSRSKGFPVKHFWIDVRTGQCTDVEWEHPYALLNDLMGLCSQLSAKSGAGEKG